MTVDELLIEIKAKNDQAKKALKDTRSEVLDTAKKTRALRDEMKLLNRKAKIDSGALKASKEYRELQTQIQKTTRDIDNLQKKQSVISPWSSKTTAAYAEVKAQADSLGKKFDELLDKEAEYKTFDLSNSGIKQIWDDLQDEIASTAAELGHYEELMQQMEESGQAFLPNDKWEQLQGEIEGATARLEEYNVTEREMLSNGTAIESGGGKSRFKAIREHLSSITKKFPLLGKSARAARGGVDSLLGGFKGLWNIAKMFLVGSGIMGWINATKQGFSNLAGYSNSTQNSLNSLKSSLATLKNAFATAFAPILDIVAPVLSAVIDWCTAAATAIAHLFSALTGKSVTIVARKASTGIDSVGSSASDAAGAVDDLNRSLMGFDQINKLDDASSSGGSGGSGGGAGGSGSMFDTVDVDSGMQSLADAIKEAWENADFTELGALAAEKLNAALESIPWTEIQATSRKIAKSIATFLNGFFGEEKLWTTVGNTLAEALNTVIEFGYTFVTTFDWQKFGKAISNAIDGFFDRIDTAKAAKALSGAIKGILDTAITTLTETDWQQVGIKVGEFLVNVDWVGVAKKAGQAIVAAFKATAAIFEGIGTAILQAIQGFLENKLGIKVDLVGNVKKIDTDPKLNRSIDTKANFTSRKDSLSKDNKTFGTKANFKSRLDNLGVVKKTFGTKANFKSRIDSLTAAQKTISGVTVKVDRVTGLETFHAEGTGVRFVKAEGGIFSGGSWKPVTYAAGGGAFNQGQMFIAREAGPELVGTIGGHTAVMNNDQIVSSVSNGVYKAVLAAMSGNMGGEVTVVLEGDAGKMFRVIRTEAKNYTRSTGMSPFPV